jgi:hypothetical protein
LFCGVLTIAFTAACTTSQSLTNPERNQLLATVQVGDRIRTVTSQGDSPEFEITAIEDDGLLRGETSEGQLVEVRIAEISELHYRKFALGKTLGLVAVIGVGALATASCENPPEAAAIGMKLC